jgi:N-dimethylarginine dimethylaminohydrolase
MLPVPEADALRFACNAVVLGNDVYLQRECPDTEATIRDNGFVPHTVDLTEFLKAGGSAKCLTLFLERSQGFFG